MTISCNTFYGGARVVILYNLSSAKCSNTAYGAKPSQTTNNHLIDDVINILTIKLFVKWLKNMMKERI